MLAINHLIWQLSIGSDMCLGYYRVNYDKRNWQLLSACLMDITCMHLIPPVSRSQLINDAANLAEGKRATQWTDLSNCHIDGSTVQTMEERHTLELCPRALVCIAKCTSSIWIGDIASTVIVCLAGLLDYSIPLELTQYLVHEPDYLPWRSAYNTFISLEAMMAAEPDYYLLRVFVVFITKIPISWMFGTLPPSTL